jgi:hypothetical protein
VASVARVGPRACSACEGAHPELRVIPRNALEHVEAMLEAGAEGAVVLFADQVAMRDFARRFP